MNTAWFNCRRLAGLLLAALVSAQPGYADDTPFIKSANSFFSETEVFRQESNKLIDNTQEVDSVLLNLENMLAVPQKAASALRQLNETLKTIKGALVAAEQVPQTRDKAQTLEKNLDSIKQPVEKASQKATEVEQAVEPVRTAVSKAENAAATALEHETAFRVFAVAHIDLIEKLIRCAEGKPTIETSSTSMIDGSTTAFHKIDQGIKPINQAYATTVAAPEQALKATITEISARVRELEQILSAVTGLQGQLQPLNDVLAELKKVLDQSVGFSFEYPCGTKMCSQNVPYPCGVKTCKKMGVPYPCGTKMCDKEVPFPCGVNTCSAKVSMSVSAVLDGADAIERKIESLLGSIAWEGLKAIGVKKYVQQLQNSANSLLNPVLSKLHLDISTNLPSLDIKLTTATLTAAQNRLDLLFNGLTKLGQDIDMARFNVPINELKSLDMKMTNLLKASSCQGPAKPASAVPKRLKLKLPGVK